MEPGLEFLVYLIVQGDIFLVSDAMAKATEVMENVEETLLKKFDYQVYFRFILRNLSTY